MPYFKVLKILVPIILVALLGYLGFDKVYTLGYNKAEKMYKEQIEETNAKLEKSKIEVEVLSNIIEASRANDTRMLQESLDKYMRAFRDGKAPVTIITPEGVCKPSPEFTTAYNEIIRRANAPKSSSSSPTK